MLDTSKYERLDGIRNSLGDQQDRKSWLLNNEHPAERIQQVLTAIEATLSALASYPGYMSSASNLLLARTWDEFQEHWWTLTVATHLARRDLLHELETALPNGRVPDMRGEISMEGQPSQFYVECKSWRFHPEPEAVLSTGDPPPNVRIERMKEKLLRQLPDDSPGVWAWDKMRDGIAGSHTLGQDGPEVGIEESQVISEVGKAVPQISSIMVKIPDQNLETIILTVPNPHSKWPGALVSSFVAKLNSAIA